MRYRYVKNAKELIMAHPNLIINNSDKSFIDFLKIFKNDFPVHLEIGMGKGKFIYQLATENPHINFIGIERFDSVIVKALNKVIENPLDNLMLLRTDAQDLVEIFKHSAIDRIYLNFSDPWPKPRHTKRRLTHKNFLKSYELLMKENAELHFKTDNIELFEFSLEHINEYPMEITYLTYDLHQSDFKGNIMTEFEKKFSKQGFKINKLTAVFKHNLKEKNDG